MITIDGSAGEGGGQILRTSLALALVTGKPLGIEKIRAGRPKPGLLRQHLTAVRAAAEIAQAEVQGAELGSRELRFVPHAVRPGEYRFDVGSAGSATLVLQTVLPALMQADKPSRLELRGGTHNPWAPPFEFLEKAFLPILARIGPRVEVRLERAGFYPAGGGVMTAHVEPARELRRVDLLERGPVEARTVRAIVSRLPLSIAEREVRAVCERLSWPEDCASVEGVDSAGPGNAVSIEIQCEQVTEVFTGFGQRGVRAEAVALGAAEQAQRYLAAGVPAGEHLADQLLVHIALAGGGSLRTLALSSHTVTNIDVIRRFLDLQIRTERLAEDVWQIAIDLQ